MIDAVIFDMDGLLLDSEPFWRKAEVDVFKSVGVILNTADLDSTMGMRIDEVVAHWFHQRPWSGVSQEVIANQIVDHVIAQVREEGEPLPGVIATLEMLHSQGVKKCIASSSSEKIISAVIDALGIGKYFEFIYSAENETHGKPHPGVFITAALKLGVLASSCLVLEDSPSGVLAAKAARMTCIAVPDVTMRDHRYIKIADRVLESLEEFTQTYWNELNS